MLKYFETMKQQREKFNLFLQEKGLTEFADKLQVSTKNELAGIVCELGEEEYVSSVDVNLMGGYYSVFVKIKDKIGNERYHHCGSSLVKEDSYVKHSEIKEFFGKLYSKR